MSIADAMATNGMKEAGFEYINLDGEPLSVAAITISVSNVAMFKYMKIVGLVTETLMETLSQIWTDFQSRNNT